MEKWKMAIIGLLVLGFVGYGFSQQQAQTPEAAVASLAPKTNKAANFVGQTLGDDKIPSWTGVGPWVNTKTPVAFDSLKGGPALVEFFRIKCSHCQEAAPFLEQLYQRYQPRGLKMVAVQSPGDYKDKTNQETMWPQVQAFVKAAGITYPVGMDKDSDYFQKQLAGQFYPTTMISDANGQVVYAQTGHDTEKSISLAVELEKQFPGQGTPKARAQDLAKFLRPMIYGTGPVDATVEKALTDDLEQRLMDKV